MRNRFIKRWRKGWREGRKRKIYEERIKDSLYNYFNCFFFSFSFFSIILLSYSFAFPLLLLLLLLHLIVLHFYSSPLFSTPLSSRHETLLLLPISSLPLITPSSFFSSFYNSFHFLIFPLLLLYRLIIELFYSDYYLFLYFLFLCTNLDLPIRIDPFPKHVPNNRLTRRSDYQRLLSER